MNSTKPSKGIILFVLVIGLAFGTPLVYKAIILAQELSAYNTQELPYDIQVGDEIKTVLEVDEDFESRIFRVSYYYFYKYHQRRDLIANYTDIPQSVQVSDRNGNILALETSNKGVFTEVLESMKLSEDTDSLQLFTSFLDKNDQYAFLQLKDFRGKAFLGKIIDSTTVNQFNLTRYSELVEYEEWPVYKDYNDLLEEKVPALLYQHQTETKGKLIFGRFEVMNNSPLRIKCLEFISDQTPKTLKKKTWGRSFRGLNLATWIACTLLFCVSLFLLINLISRLLKGKSFN